MKSVHHLYMVMDEKVKTAGICWLLWLCILRDGLLVHWNCGFEWCSRHGFMSAFCCALVPCI